MTGLIPYGSETALAGALAESGVAALSLNGVELRVRKTDLPAELKAAKTGTVLTAPTARFVSEPNGWRWECDDAELAGALSEISS